MNTGKPGKPCPLDPNCHLTVGHDSTCEIEDAEDLRTHAGKLLARADEIDRRAGRRNHA